MRADDSDGMIGELCRDVLELHRQACPAGVADPQRLAKWMVRFAFEDQDFFEIDPVAYAGALGEKGLVVYRREVATRSDPAIAPEDRSATLRDFYGGFPSFAAKYAAERLAIIDRHVDRHVDRLVELLGGDLSSPHQFQRVAEAMVELDRVDDALRWARRGIAETAGWQVRKLYDLTAELLTDADELDEVVELRRDHHERVSSASTYAKLKAAAGAIDAWGTEVARGPPEPCWPNGTRLTSSTRCLRMAGPTRRGWWPRAKTTRSRRRSGSAWPRSANRPRPATP
ncbi:MAG: hypothetical protein ACR2H3_11835 [Acidimicrobiales bacterium]